MRRTVLATLILVSIACPAFGQRNKKPNKPAATQFNLMKLLTPIDSLNGSFAAWLKDRQNVVNRILKAAKSGKTVTKQGRAEHWTMVGDDVEVTFDSPASKKVAIDRISSISDRLAGDLKANDDGLLMALGYIDTQEFNRDLVGAFNVTLSKIIDDDSGVFTWGFYTFRIDGLDLKEASESVDYDLRGKRLALMKRQKAGYRVDLLEKKAGIVTTKSVVVPHFILLSDDEIRKELGTKRVILVNDAMYGIYCAGEQITPATRGSSEVP